MNSIRKLLLLGAMALTALALTASQAPAAVTVLPEQPAGPSCGTVTLMSNHQVEGGCHWELESTGSGIPMHVYIPAKTTITNCEVYLEGRVGSNGEGYATIAVLTPPHSGVIPCTRMPCEEANGSMIPWPFHIREHGVSNKEVEMTLCLRSVTDPPGSPGIRCELHLSLTDISGHNYQAGNGTERFCENNPPNPTPHSSLPLPISFEPTLSTALEAEKIEITH